MNILLIDKRVSRYEDIVAAIDPALAVGVVFDYFEDTFDTLKARMRALGITTGNSVGLLQHNYRAPMFSMLASADLAPVSSIVARDPELARWSQFRDFIAWCKSEFSAAHFDMMACALYSNKDWKYVIDTLTVQTGVTVRASTDNTGSAALGGDWFLESHTGVNLKTVYFTETIEDYRGVLYSESNNIREYSTKGVATGSVVAWGESGYGGTTPENVSSDVVAVYYTSTGFAALKTDGSVVAWGDPDWGGGADPGITGGVVAIYSTFNSFAALKNNGSVQAWGHSNYGGSAPSSVTEADSGVVAVYSTGYAFAALKSDGSVVTWGRSQYGGDSSLVSTSLVSGVVAVYSTFGAFAALKTDGSVIAWGDSSDGGDSSSVSTSLVSGVVAIYSTGNAFAALKSDGSLIVWGNSTYGGDASSVSTSLVSGVVAVYSTGYAFAALKTDGSVVAWGNSEYSGGDASSVSTSLVSGVVAVYPNMAAFAALKSDGSVVTWGVSSDGGDSSSVSTSLVSGVVAVYGTLYAFAALKTDGSVVTWGNSGGGSDSSAVSTSLVSGVVAIYSTQTAFTAVKADGSVVAWGYSEYGGDASEVSLVGVVSIYSVDTAFAALKTTATTFNLSAAHYRDMDRYDILRKKENRRRVNLTTLNNNVFTLSQARDIQSFNPTIPAGKTFTIIVTDYTASSYSITSTATVPNSAGSFIIACDEGEHVTISGTTYVNYGTYVYRVETDNTYTKITTATIGGTSFTLYGGDGINSSGIALMSHWIAGIDQPYALATHGSYMYVGRRGTGHGIDRYNLLDGSLDTGNWVDGTASNMFNIASLAVDSSYLYVVASVTAENTPSDPTDIFKISLADASIVSDGWMPDVALVGTIAIYGAFMYAVHYSDGIIRKLRIADGSVANANFATVSVVGDTQNILMNIDDAGTYAYVQRGLGRISKIAMSDGSTIDADWINVEANIHTDGFVLYGPSVYATDISNGNTVQINLASKAVTDAAWATSAGWGTAETSRIAMTVFGSSLYAARTDTGTIDKFALPAVSNICFPASAPVQTDQGVVEIARLNPTFHTIQGKRVIDVTKTVTNDSFLIRIGRDALGKDYPAQDTVISRLHKLEYDGRMVAAEWFVDRIAGVKRIPYSGEPLYNVILAEPRTMRVNNLVCETLLPSNPIAKLYGVNSKYTEYTRDIILSLLKMHTASNNREAYCKVISSL
jgi:hypothetical protein